MTFNSAQCLALFLAAARLTGQQNQKLRIKMGFLDRINHTIDINHSLVCVGLDPLPERFPSEVRGKPNAVFEFNKNIIDATADLVCAYKPQIAHYHALEAENQLSLTIEYIQKNYPEIPVILDAKRGDIGSTAEQYAKEAFERYGADAVTVNPYMGVDTIKPFTQYADKGVILLCRTSNAGAAAIQNLLVGKRYLYEVIAEKAVTEWNAHNNILLVVGATNPEELKHIRYLTGDTTLLVPGLGAQGGNVEATVTNGLNSQKKGMIVNSSRGITYASENSDFKKAARQATIKLRGQINQYR
ncbi:MAG: orotidine-5'-phosphate decarboxylase [Endozoicomonas sp. (ex Botrylloides leachii)]|nr:orotidine-5'-phosphate decarboxylase [Endozoicomonas sp. (ex Botrylloides leachii)]